MANDSNIDPADLPILVALCVRHEEAWERRENAAAQKAKAAADEAAADAELTKLGKVVVALGVDKSEEGWFEPIRNAAGHDVFDKAMRDAGFEFEWDEVNVPVRTNTVVPEATPEVLADDASVRELVLGQLRKAGKSGSTAAPIRAYIEKLRGSALHEKTVGMTLYRLVKDGLARRDGRIWFFVSETKNPGGATPGLINRENKRGEEL